LPIRNQNTEDFPPCVIVFQVIKLNFLPYIYMLAENGEKMYGICESWKLGIYNRIFEPKPSITHELKPAFFGCNFFLLFYGGNLGKNCFWYIKDYQRTNQDVKFFQNFQAAAAKGTDLWHALFAARTISSICPSTYTRKQSDLNSLYTCTKTLNKVASKLVSHKTIMSRLSLHPFKIEIDFRIKIKKTDLPKQVDIFRRNN